jgi:phosphopantothenoylcysteine decarboxylase/phosphopantothenate--cysteine ligase
VTAPTRVLLCVTGGIAAYKAPELVRAFIAAGCEVRVVMSAAAKAFATELSLATVSRHPVRSEILDVSEEGRVGHIELADWPEVVVVAPATADVLAKAAAGLADDLVSVILLATRAPVLFAPAMNTNMWHHPATVANLRVLASRGAAFVGPDAGELACGWIGAGRMIDPAVIVDAARGRIAAPWRGRRVLVSAGPTRTWIDAVRFFSNASTGAMGFAIAAEAARRGADVTLVAGPVDRPTPAGVRRIDVEVADEMLAAMDAELASAGGQLVAMVAAVADLAPLAGSPDKLDKSDLITAIATAPWRRGVDVLQTLTERHGTNSYFLGFAAQTAGGDADAVRAELLARGAAKRAAKRAHALFVNRVGVADSGFATDTNTGLLLVGDEVHDAGAPRLKAELAAWLLDRLDGPWARERLGG